MEEEEEVKVEGIFSLKRSRGMKISVFMPAKKPLLEERVQVYVYGIELDSFKFSDPVGRHNHR